MLIRDKEIIEAVFSQDNEYAINMIDKIDILREKNVKYGILKSILLFTPPTIDEEDSLRKLLKMNNSNQRLDVSVWGGYLFSVLYSAEDFFSKPLSDYRDSAVCLYMRSMIDDKKGYKKSAIELIKKSVAQSLFPFNVVRYGDFVPNLTKECRSKIWYIFRDLVIDNNLPSEPSGNVHGISTIEGLNQLYWDNMITGRRITKELWDLYFKWMNENGRCNFDTSGSRRFLL